MIGSLLIVLYFVQNDGGSLQPRHDLDSDMDVSASAQHLINQHERFDAVVTTPEDMVSAFPNDRNF